VCPPFGVLHNMLQQAAARALTAELETCQARALGNMGEGRHRNSRRAALSHRSLRRVLVIPELEFFDGVGDGSRAGRRDGRRHCEAPPRSGARRARS
jgi:hypothetical protein